MIGPGLVFTRFPRTGIPDHFDSYNSFQRYVELLIETGCIDDGRKIYWDVRPHPFFPTLEFRICDIPTRVDDTIAIAALFQALVAKLDKLLEQNLTFRRHHKMLIEENKWRAVRYGLDGNIIDFGKGKEAPVRDHIRDLLQFVDDVIDDLGSRKEIEHIYTILERGTSADEQLQIQLFLSRGKPCCTPTASCAASTSAGESVMPDNGSRNPCWRETGDIKAVADRLIERTMENVPCDVSLSRSFAKTSSTVIC